MSTIDFPVPCAGCGADLRGADFRGRCPRCSRRVTDTINLGYVDQVLFTVTADVPCAQCGYNLRTLALSSVCPECGTPVGRSLQGRELRHADVAWLRRVRAGVTVLLFAEAVDAAQPLWGFLVKWGFIDAGRSSDWWGTVNLAWLAVTGVAVFAITSSRPSSAPRAELRALRWLARIAILIQIIVRVGMYGHTVPRALFRAEVPVSFLIGLYYGYYDYAAFPIDVAVELPVLVSYACLSVILGFIARREGKVWLTRLALMLAGLVVALVALLFVLLALNYYGAWLESVLSGIASVQGAARKWRNGIRAVVYPLGYAAIVTGVVAIVWAWRVLTVALAGGTPQGTGSRRRAGPASAG